MSAAPHLQTVEDETVEERLARKRADLRAEELTLVGERLNGLRAALDACGAVNDCDTVPQGVKDELKKLAEAARVPLDAADAILQRGRV